MPYPVTKWHSLFIGLVLVLTAAACAPTALAGPYFQIPRPLKLASLSRDAVQHLSMARISVIEMFSAIEQKDEKKARERKSAALEDLTRAIDVFKEMAGATSAEMELSMEGRTDFQDHAIRHFKTNLENYRQRFSAIEELPRIPDVRTERDLVELATVLVVHYRRTLSETEIAIPLPWEKQRELIVAEIAILDLGSVADLVWRLSAE